MLKRGVGIHPLDEQLNRTFRTLSHQSRHIVSQIPRCVTDRNASSVNCHGKWIFWIVGFAAKCQPISGMKLRDRRCHFRIVQVKPHPVHEEEIQIAALIVRDGTGKDLDRVGLLDPLTPLQQQQRLAAALALWRIDQQDHAAVPALIESLRDGDGPTRQATVRALVHLGPAAEPAIPLLIEALRDDDNLVRARAAEALGAIGPAASEATPHLIERVLESEQHFKIVQPAAAEALGKLGPNAVPHLITATDHPRLPARIAAVKALGEIGAPARAAIPKLLDLLEDDYVSIRVVAREAIQRIREDDTSP